MIIFKVILLTVVIMAIAIAGLATQIIFKKGGKFPNTHIGANKYLKSQGVSCAQTDDKIEQAKVRKELRFKKILMSDTENVSSC